MRTLCFALLRAACLVVLTVPYPHSAYAQQPAALAIEGATLIDGNGGAPVRDSAIVIQGNRINYRY